MGGPGFSLQAFVAKKATKGYPLQSLTQITGQ